MVEPYGAPRRVSMSYLLGFSKKPFKDPKPPSPPRPPQPSALRQLVTTPGGIVEWTASDGRKGKLNGTGKQRLNAATLAKVSSEARPGKETTAAKSETKKAASIQAASEAGGLLDLFATADEGETKATSGTTEKNGKGDDKNPHGFTEEQDKKLMEWKSENGNRPWTECANVVGKSLHQCKERFQKIKPADWRPNNAKGKGAGGGDSGKKDKNNDNSNNNNNNENQNQNQNQNGDGKKEEGSNNATGWNSTNTWSNTEGFGGTGNDQTWETNGANDGGFEAIANAWVMPAPANPASKANSKALSHKSAPRTRSRRSSQHKAQAQTTPAVPVVPEVPPAPAAAPLEIELKPDETFSANDLRLIARILQQDASMVWNRVSWRFSDKTGRTLHPDIFERKITGHVEGKESEHASRRGT